MFLQLKLDNTNMCCWFYVLNIVIEKKNLIKLKFQENLVQLWHNGNKLHFKRKNKKKQKICQKCPPLICSFKKHKAWFCFKIK